MVEEKMFGDLKYLIRNGDKKNSPVLIFLPGAGTRGDSYDLLRNNNATKKLEKYSEFVYVTPLCDKNTWFDLFETLKKFVEYIALQEYADRSRIYLMGNSMGGYATWQLAMSMPEYFAAIVPICGGGMYWNASRLKDVPVWAFHGSDDQTVFVEESIKMVDAVKKHGGDARLTIYQGVKHNSWDDTFDNPEVFSWLLSHKSTGKDVETQKMDQVIYG